MRKGIITDIKRFAVHDGDGIRTTVFFKGCPLNCIWCHNPENISFNAELEYHSKKCIGCGECALACSQNSHSFVNGVHLFSRQTCIGCGTCESVCLGEALKHRGRQVTVQELMPVLLEDADYYNSSGGGVTLSGGECLSQADLCAELLRALKAEGINTAVDTCGYAPRSAFDKVAEHTDVFLYDIKAIDEDVHIKCTGRGNKLILDNLRYIDSLGKTTEIRIPYVPGYNSDQIGKIKEFLEELKHVSRVKVLAYHNYAEYKYNALGIKNTLPVQLPTAEEVEAAQRLFE